MPLADGAGHTFHQAIAAATYNKLLISLFDTLNIVRRSTVWGQLRSTSYRSPITRASTSTTPSTPRSQAGTPSWPRSA